MGAIYCGLLASDGYLFATNDVFGANREENAIVKINEYCAAFAVTAKGNLLIKVRRLLSEIVTDLGYFENGLSTDLAMAILKSFKNEFKQNLQYKTSPVPFLLLLIGYDSVNLSGLEYIFMRNRVVEIIEKDGEKEYLTEFDTLPSVPATNLFYGHAELPQYLYQQVLSDCLDLETMKLFVHFAMTATHKIDVSLFSNTCMGILSKDTGFQWIRAKELQKLSQATATLEELFSKTLFDLFASSIDSPDNPENRSIYKR